MWDDKINICFLFCSFPTFYSEIKKKIFWEFNLLSIWNIIGCEAEAIFFYSYFFEYDFCPAQFRNRMANT